MVRTVTATDRAIIRLLQQNARISYAELGRATGIPESTVRRRMDRLQQRGVIEFAMLAEPSKLGYDLRAMIGLRVDLHRLKEIANTLRDMNEVIFASFVTGNFDILVHVVVRSQEALVQFLTDQLASIEGVKSTETFVMPYIIKPATAWVLPEDADEDEEVDTSEVDRPGGEAASETIPTRGATRKRETASRRGRA
jgi:Lrp/AsnC family transcriptional regulator for asnA, asnC and gidA